MFSGTRSRCRFAVGSTLTVLASAALALVVAPSAVAAPAQGSPLPVGCVGPVDGVVVCTTGSRGPEFPQPLIGEVYVDDPDSLSMQGVLVVLEECLADSCRVVSVATGSGWAVHTPTVLRAAGAHYRTTASWVDSNGRQHHGVSAQLGGQ
jgi:hypothetical protein